MKIKHLIIGILFACAAASFAAYGGNVAKAAVVTDYAVALSEYKIADYDASYSVIAPDGSLVRVMGGKFLISSLGDYKILKNGVEIKRVEAIYKSFETEFVYDVALPSVVKTNETVRLPFAEIYSVDQRFDEYAVTVKKDGATVDLFDGVNKAINYSFSVSGTYTVVYGVTDRFGFKITDETEISVEADRKIIGLSVTENEERYVLNEIDFSSVQGVYEGKNYPVSVEILNGDGEKQVLDGFKFLPVETGDYVVKVTCDFPDEKIVKTVPFKVVLANGSLFSNGKNVSKITMDAKNGIELRFDGAGSYVYFNRLIDLDALGSEEKLISFEVPYNEYSDVNDLRLTLIDALDPSNYISVYWRRSKSVGWEHLTYMLVEFNGYAIGLNNENGSMLPRTVYGAIMNCSFTRKVTSDFNIYYNKEENAIYSYRSSTVPYLKILDLDDEEALKGYEIWKGFSSNLIYAKLDLIDNVNSAVKIKTLGGVDFTSDSVDLFDDNYLRFNYRGDVLLGGEDKLIDGYKDNIYRLPYPITENGVFGDIAVNLELKLKNGADYDNVSASVDDYAFVPAAAGEYKAVYSYTDLYGVPREKEFAFTIKGEKAPKINIYGSDITADIMSYCQVPEFSFKGGTGNITKTVTYTYNDKQVQPDEDGRIFLNEKGAVEISISAKDEIDISGNKNFYIIVNSDKQIIETDNFPLSYISGREYTLPDFSATDYSLPSGSVGYDMAKSVFVNGVKVGDDLKFTCPTGVNEITVSYYGGKGTAKEVRKDVNVKVVDNGATNRVTNAELGGLFNMPAGLSGTLFEYGYAINFGSDFEAEYSHYLGADGLNMAVSVLPDSLNFSGIRFELTDSADKDQSIVVALRNFDDKTADMYLNGAFVYTLAGVNAVYSSGAFKGVNYVKFSFTLNALLANIVNDARQRLCTVGAFASGKAYTGFENGAVKLKIAAENCVGDSTLVINALSNQNFTSYAFDRGDKSGPAISTLTDFPNATIGEVISIPAAFGYDVLQGKCKVGLKVISPSGKETLFDGEAVGNELQINEYGNYKFIYEAKDYFGNSNTLTHNLFIEDVEKPIVSVYANIPSAVKKGTSISLNAFSATDNIGVAIKKVYVKTPQSLLVEITDSYTFALKGEYQVIYFAQDAVGNFEKIVYGVSVE